MAAAHTPEITNKKAFHEFFILEKFECGLALIGCEVKSLRAGNASLQEGYCKFIDDELFLVDVHVAEYPNAAHVAYVPTRPRKLLLHARELRKLKAAVAEKGLTIVPLRIYLHKRVFKAEIGLARGKKLYDKREDMKERDWKRSKAKIEGRRR